MIPMKNLKKLSTTGNLNSRAMQEARRAKGHPKNNHSVIFQAAMLDDVVAPTIVAAADVDKPRPKTGLYLSSCYLRV